MRSTVSAYVAEIHRTYLAQADTFPPAVRGRMPLIGAGSFHVAAAASRNLHVLATSEPLGPLRGQEVELTGENDAMSWTLRFYDPVVIPELGLIDETSEPAPAEVRHVLGVTTVLYHQVTQPGSQLSAHHAMHVGTGLANGDSAVARDFETIRARCRGFEHLVDELAGAAVAGLPHAQALLAAAVAPRDQTLAELANQHRPNPDAVRKALLDHVGGRAQWTPEEPEDPP